MPLLTTLHCSLVADIETERTFKCYLAQTLQCILWQTAAAKGSNQVHRAQAQLSLNLNLCLISALN